MGRSGFLACTSHVHRLVSVLIGKDGQFPTDGMINSMLRGWWKECGSEDSTHAPLCSRTVRDVAKLADRAFALETFEALAALLTWAWAKAAPDVRACFAVPITAEALYQPNGTEDGLAVVEKLSGQIPGFPSFASELEVRGAKKALDRGLGMLDWLRSNLRFFNSDSQYKIAIFCIDLAAASYSFDRATREQDIKKALRIGWLVARELPLESLKRYLLEGMLFHNRWDPVESFWDHDLYLKPRMVHELERPIKRSRHRYQEVRDFRATNLNALAYDAIATQLMCKLRTRCQAGCPTADRLKEKLERLHPRVSNPFIRGEISLVLGLFHSSPVSDGSQTPGRWSLSKAHECYVKAYDQFKVLAAGKKYPILAAAAFRAWKTNPHGSNAPEYLEVVWSNQTQLRYAQLTDYRHVRKELPPPTARHFLPDEVRSRLPC